MVSLTLSLSGISISSTWPQYKTWNETGYFEMNSLVKMTSCKLCGASVKGLKAHLRYTHSMNVKDYENIDNVDENNEDIKSEVTKAQTSAKVDIRDKTLKSCVKCEVSFPTRREFIEHCQIVHGMKFKLKSGESLPAPPVKRKASSESPDPDVKRMRWNIS